MSGFFLNSNCLFAVATRASQNASRQAVDARANGSTEPLIAVIFAAATAEAVLNELQAMAEGSPPDPVEGFGEPPSQVALFARILKDLEESKAQPTLKFALGMYALTGHPLDKGASPFEEFAALMNLRNSIVHLKLDNLGVSDGELSVKTPKVLSKLASFKILSTPKEAVITGWLQQVMTPAAAQWACDTTSKIVVHLVEAIPDGVFRQTAELAYLRSGQYSQK